MHIFIAVAVIRSLAVLPTILLNAMVILAVATRRRLRTNSNILVACLAGTDLLVGLVLFPIAIAVEVRRILGAGYFCTWEKVCVVASIGMSFPSFGHLVVISIDRYVAIKHSLRYPEIVTNQRMIIGVILAWAVAAFLTCQEIIMAVIDTETKIYSTYLQVMSVNLGIIGSLYVAVIIYTNGYIFSETRRQNKRLQAEQLTYEEAKKAKKDNKAAKILALILGALILTLAPSIIAVVLTAFMHNPLEPRFRSVVWSWIMTFSMSSSLVNPIIYFWRIKKLRHASLEILHLRQPVNHAILEMAAVQRNRPENQPSAFQP